MKTMISLLGTASLISAACMAPEGLGSGSGEFDGDTEFNQDDFDQFLSVMLGISDEGDVEHAQLACHKGDLSAQMFETDAWKECQAKTGLTPIEYLAAALTQAIVAGDLETAEAVAEAGQEEDDAEIAAGASREDLDAQIERGQEIGAQA